jgi:peptidoglycan hydrolase-like protein with peptidoglycan-binding domain
VEATGWDKQWVNSLLKLPPQGIDMLNSPPEGPGNVLANLTAADLVRLRNAIALIKRTGAPAKTLLLWSQKEPDYAQAEEVIETVKSRYEQSDWLEVARGLNDPLREKQRTALVDFLVARMSWPHPQLKIWSSLKESVTELQRKLNVALAPLQPVLPAVLPLKVDGIFGPNTETAIETFQDTNKIDVDGIVGPATWAALDRAVGDVFDKNSLLGHFLIDTEMSSCMLTSRIKQAISSVQMFIQRCLLNLESEVSPDDIDADQWKWMKNYRVWEANRKVFLYPENWIEPELRDDKTPFFKELETELLQNELTDETVETALVNYLYKLDGVARLDIRGFCKEEKEQDGEEKEIYHVFGRTWNPPFVYYYRKGTFPKNGPLADEWTPWEPVDLDIQGDHLIPLVANRRLYLFWLVLDEKPDPESPQTGGVEPHTRWEARLAWSEFKWGKWAPRRVTFDVIHADKGAPNKNTPKDEYRLRLVTFGGPEKIDLLLLRHLWKGSEENEISGIHEFTRKGIFSFNVCDQKMETWDVDSGESVTITGPEVSFVEGQAYRTPLSSLILQDLPEKEILKKIDLKLGVPFYVLTDTDLSREGPFSFCYGDPTCTYLARPLPENVTVPQDTETWTESTVTIKKPAQIDTKKGWTKPSSDLVDDLAGNTMSGS